MADVWRTHAHLPNYEAVRAAALDTFQGLPETFEDAYRNPCWIESDPMQPTGATTRTRAPLATAQQTALRNGTTAILSPTAQTARFLSAVSSGRRTRRAVSQAAGGASGTGTLRCLPYFQILGVSKCGTTDLYQRLSRHLDMIDCGYKVCGSRWGWEASGHGSGVPGLANHACDVNVTGSRAPGVAQRRSPMMCQPRDTLDMLL